MLIDTSKIITSELQITSKIGQWMQHLLIENPNNVCVICHSLEHNSKSCNHVTLHPTSANIADSHNIDLYWYKRIENIL